MGCVYILENPAIPDLIKIGFTNRTAETRARELYEGRLGVPKPFVVVHINECEEPEKLEAKIHTRLAGHRVNTKREFFRYPADEAYELLQNLDKKNQFSISLLWEKIKPMFTLPSILRFVIGNIIWDSLLKPFGTTIWKLLSYIGNLFSGPH